MTDPIKAKIIELVPEILELKFGCRVPQGLMEETPEINLEGTRIFRAQDKNGWSSTYWLYADQYEEWIKKVEGRPITLADVLRAIQHSRAGGVKTNSWYVRRDGTFFEWEAFAGGGDGHHSVKSSYITWNLTTDYDNQTEETKDFIGKLLGV